MTAMFTVSVSGKKFGSTPLMYQALRAAQMKASVKESPWTWMQPPRTARPAGFNTFQMAHC